MRDASERSLRTYYDRSPLNVIFQTPHSTNCLPTRERRNIRKNVRGCGRRRKPWKWKTYDYVTRWIDFEPRWSACENNNCNRREIYANMYWCKGKKSLMVCFLVFATIVQLIDAQWRSGTVLRVASSLSRCVWDVLTIHGSMRVTVSASTISVQPEVKIKKTT